MTPQIARLYAYVLPVFWPYLWLQLRWIFKRQDVELRTLLISVTRWGYVSIVYVGDHWRAYKKPAPVKPSWDNPVWESHTAPNMADVFRAQSCALFLAAVQAFEAFDATRQHPLGAAAGADTS